MAIAIEPAPVGKRASSAPCPSCGGKGKQLVEPPTGPDSGPQPEVLLVTCERCFGTGKGKPARFSLSHMEKAEGCLLSARIGRLIGPSGPPAVRGRIIHSVLDVLTEEAYRAGLTRWDPAAAKVRAHQVLKDGIVKEPLSKAVFEEVLEHAERWALTTEFSEEPIVQLVEYEFVRKQGRFWYSGRIDRVEVEAREGWGNVCQIDDYKTGPWVPPQEDFEAGLQLPFYAWGIHGELGDVVDHYDLGTIHSKWGKRTTYRNEDGDPLLLTPEEAFGGIEAYLDVAGARLDKAWDAEQVEATPGDHCWTCDAPTLCPLPKEVRPEASIDTDAEAQEVLAEFLTLDVAREYHRKALKAWVKREDTGDLVETGGAGAFFKHSTIEKSKKDEIKAFIADNGGNPSDYYKDAPRNDFLIDKAYKAGVGEGS